MENIAKNYNSPEKNILTKLKPFLPFSLPSSFSFFPSFFPSFLPPSERSMEVGKGNWLLSGLIILHATDTPSSSYAIHNETHANVQRTTRLTPWSSDPLKFSTTNCLRRKIFSKKRWKMALPISQKNKPLCGRKRWPPLLSLPLPLSPLSWGTRGPLFPFPFPSCFRHFTERLPPPSPSSRFKSKSKLAARSVSSSYSAF